MAATTKEIAMSINSLLHFSSEDQDRMLDVIGDFFSYPTNSSVHDPEEDFSDDEEMEVETGKINNNINFNACYKYMYNSIQSSLATWNDGIGVYSFK